MSDRKEALEILDKSTEGRETNKYKGLEAGRRILGI